ncbi:MAG: CHAD domain-containing protein [Proteobacteria bacterium]|nr:CHAD domain-containing protein [Pseudomonadota bacterium]
MLVDTGLSEAEIVHDVRKAFKRWRALMRLLSKPIGEPADRMRTEARDLMRGLSGSRDAQAALDALADLGKSDRPFSATSTKTIEARLTSLRSEAEAAHFTPQLRQQVEQYLDGAALALERWPLAEIEFGALADQMTRTFRRARQLVPDDWHEAESDSLHELRKRVVEHRHQMELLEPLWPRLAKVWAQEAQRLRERLGACQDLAVFARLMAPRGPLAPWRSRLTPLIEERRAAHLDAAAKLAGRLFAEKPKAFRRRIAALWQARQSLDD